MAVIEIPDSQAMKLKAMAAEQGLTLQAWLGKLAEEPAAQSPSRRAAACSPDTDRRHPLKKSTKTGARCSAVSLKIAIDRLTPVNLFAIELPLPGAAVGQFREALELVGVREANEIFPNQFLDTRPHRFRRSTHPSENLVVNFNRESHAPSVRPSSNSTTCITCCPGRACAPRLRVATCTRDWPWR